MAKKTKVNSAVAPGVILGHFDGECADANITNLNGLDITREVWENVFNSDEYKQAIELGWYIGFLGHPEDPNCMDFEHACIVMREGHIDENGKVFGKFDLIDTPVGRIVSAFIDAGVTFGISVRGAGDIEDNSVDPDTFVFRGFDLVSFPAFPESIPEYTKIAASSDVETRKKVKAISSAVKDNIKHLNTVAAVEVLQPMFAKQSEEFKALEERKLELQSDESDEDGLAEQKLDAITALYVETSEQLKSALAENAQLKAHLAKIQSNNSRRIAAINRITSAQVADLGTQLDKVSARYQTVCAASRILKKDASDNNLKYRQRIASAKDNLSKKDEVIAGLQRKLDETVRKVNAAESRASNLGEVTSKLRSEVVAKDALIGEYQSAYATLYASAVGAAETQIRVTGSTTVDQLRKQITASVKPHTPSDLGPTLEFDVDEGSDGDLVII